MLPRTLKSSKARRGLAKRHKMRRLVYKVGNPTYHPAQNERGHARQRKAHEPERKQGTVALLVGALKEKVFNYLRPVGGLQKIMK